MAGWEIRVRLCHSFRVIEQALEDIGPYFSVSGSTKDFVKRRTLNKNPFNERLKQVPKSYPVNRFAHYDLAYPSVDFRPYQYVQRSRDSWNLYPWDSFVVDENLSCLPRLQKREQKSEPSEIYM